MIRVIALTQFVFIALGTMSLMVLAKTGPGDGTVASEWRAFLSQYGYWMVLIPMVFAVIAEVLQRLNTGEAVLKLLQAIGIGMTAAILVIYGWLILGF